MSTQSSKKSALKLKAPSSDSEASDSEQEFEVAVISPSISTVTTDSYLDNCTTTTEGTSINSKQYTAVDFVDDEPLIVKATKKVVEALENEVEEMSNEIESLEEALSKKKNVLKEKRKELKKWEKRVSTPTTAENAHFAVVIKNVNRQIHSEEDGQLFYKTETSKTLLRLSATKVSTKSLREAGKPVVDGKKKVSVHIKDTTVTLQDLVAAKETELVEQAKTIEMMNNK